MAKSETTNNAYIHSVINQKHLWVSVKANLFLVLALIAFSAGCSQKQSQLQKPPHAHNLNLPVLEIRTEKPVYSRFCKEFPKECDLSGETVLKMNPAIWQILNHVNTTVNREITLRDDLDLYHVEELWSLPTEGFGDCEDIALEKRSQLVQLGLPRGTLRMAVGYHRIGLYPHAVLTVETNEGTFVMDSNTDEIRLWHKTPYNLETRERTDGRWDRFDQDSWVFE